MPRDRSAHAPPPRYRAPMPPRSRPALAALATATFYPSAAPRAPTAADCRAPRRSCRYLNGSSPIHGRTPRNPQIHRCIESLRGFQRHLDSKLSLEYSDCHDCFSKPPHRAFQYRKLARYPHGTRRRLRGSFVVVTLVTGRSIGASVAERCYVRSGVAGGDGNNKRERLESTFGGECGGLRGQCFQELRRPLRASLRATKLVGAYGLQTTEHRLQILHNGYG